ncbi:MAG: lipoyl(octanoyl) transferase LipB [Verrucomicrobiota bacterium]
MALDFQWLGRVSYEDGLSLQEDLVAKRQAGEIPDTVLYLEHDPVYTIGRTRDRSSLRDTQEKGLNVVEINRGGQATYHGPGQLVGYLILDLTKLGKDLHIFLRAIEQALIDGCREMGFETDRREGLTGVWIENRKIASIGVGVRKWVTMHGFAINVAKDLSGFEAIIPCGIADVEMTSIELETGESMEVQAFSEALTPHFSREIGALAGSAVS